ncbi:aromatic acid exporter family protein [Psychrobacillus sp. INOP01]|uniref:FUSC family protein n=1 Tax=Psychrobacillus sp. INOP01 TaxID=2829187 RepID=UPI001BA4FD35|nr:aromatic acid exporter family protein [Psychrobacillus sp. INOP01]QUG42801.1 aromatic acid exporter family protein [Psychrobacillus sp. INOP01]
MKLGARIFKTGVAIVFSLFIADLLQLPSPVFAGIAAIFAIQPSIYRSYLTVTEQIQGNLIGAVIAVVFTLVFGNDYIAVGFAAIVAITLMLKLKLEKTISLALVTVIAIMEIQGDDFLVFALLRFAAMLVGVISAFIVNLVFLPPKFEKKLFNAIHYTQDEIIRWLRIAVRQASDHQSTKQTINQLKDRLVRVDQLYSFFKEERGYTKKANHTKGRKLVVYRELISTSYKSLDVLKKLHLHENELTQLPEHFRMMIKERLDALLTYHEQLHLKFIGKLRPEHMEWNDSEAFLQRQEVMDIFVKQITITQMEEEFSSYHLLHLLSSILKYEEQLEHVDRLITSYQNFHSEELTVQIEETPY